jgi:signal transduction histidine kinase
MLKTLRWQLTLLYFLAALGLVGLMGAVTYALIGYDFQHTTDLALQYKMATEFRNLGLPVPPELAKVEQIWLDNNQRRITLPSPEPTGSSVPRSLIIDNQTNVTPAANPTFPASEQATETPILQASVASGANPTDKVNKISQVGLVYEVGKPAGGSQDSENPEPMSAEQEEDESNKRSVSRGGESDENAPISEVPNAEPAKPDEEALQATSVPQGTLIPTAEPVYDAENDLYDANLSPIFIVPQETNPNPVAIPNHPAAPISVDQAASTRALQYGIDWRTIRLSDGIRVRLLTYRIAGNPAPTVLQIGRLLTDQDRVLQQYLIGLLIFGGASSILLALASWWLAGRSLSPAQKAWDQQQNFISNASHELRTPLTLLRATADYGLRQQPAEDQTKVLKDILDESDYMSRLVDDLLLLSRLDTRRLELKREIILLPELLTETIHQMEKISQTKNIALVVESTHGKVWGDPARLRQVLLIVLDNALRYTPPGGKIRLQTRMVGKQIEVSVLDNGQGISAEHLPHLFKRFYQVRTANIDDSRNNGLGLSIAKGLIEAQHGTIRIESAVGKGTQVRLTLPGDFR